MHLYCGSHVGRQKNVNQSIFPFYIIIENSPTSFVHDAVFDGPNDFKFGTKTCYMVLQAIRKFLAN